MDPLQQLEQKLKDLSPQEKEEWMFKLLGEVYELSPDRIEELNKEL